MMRISRGAHSTAALAAAGGSTLTNSHDRVGGYRSLHRLAEDDEEEPAICFEEIGPRREMDVTAEREGC